MSKQLSRLTGRWLAVGLFLWLVSGGAGLAGSFAAESEEEAHSHEEALAVVTEDTVLKEQIVKVTEGLRTIHDEMARRRKAIQAETDGARRAALYAQLDAVRKEHDALEDLLHDLVEEARATEWTKIDEALRRARAVERYEERRYRQEEVLRDRQQ